jgi:hypothetical protein
LNYLSRDDDSDLLNGAVELIKVNLTLVLDVEEFEALSQESLLSLVGRAFLHKLGFHF